MSRNHSKHVRVLGIAVSSRGIGFAVFERKSHLIDWGVKVVKTDKNAKCLSNVAKLIDHYLPDAIVLENTRSGGSKRRSRVQTLTKDIVNLAESMDIETARFSRDQLNCGLMETNRGTKHALAKYLVDRFPDELGFRLPPKRRAWMNEDSRMDIFDAVALAEHFLRSRK